MVPYTGTTQDQRHKYIGSKHAATPSHVFDVMFSSTVENGEGLTSPQTSLKLEVAARRSRPAPCSWIHRATTLLRVTLSVPTTEYYRDEKDLAPTVCAVRGHEYIAMHVT